MKTHYDVLGVSRDADYETVKAAYRRAMKAAHPDVHDGSEAAEQHSQQIIAAYAVLRDPGQRSWYDHNLQNQRRRLRLLVMIGVMSAWLVSASTLFVLNFLLSSEGKTPLALTTGSGAYKAAGTKEPAAEPETPATPRAALAQKRLPRSQPPPRRCRMKTAKPHLPKLVLPPQPMPPLSPRRKRPRRISATERPPIASRPFPIRPLS